MLVWAVIIRQHLSRAPRGPRQSRKSGPIRTLPLPAPLLNVQTFRSAVWIPDASSGRSNVSTIFTPNSFALNLFADPHPLNPVTSIFYKNIRGQGAPPFPAGSDFQASQRSIDISQSPLECAVPKKVGVGGKLLTRNPMRITVLRSIATKDLSSNPTKDFYPEGHRDEGPLLNPIASSLPQRTVTFPQHRTPRPLCSAAPTRTIDVHAGAKFASQTRPLTAGSLNMSTPTGSGSRLKI